ncbi:MAG: bifunctional adenosylcobinamide kinase/adenosylcobinamide-phosphate guanylyltransferase [Ilumatobacteraceae bacterium]
MPSTFVLGGARSGKSSFVERRAAALCGSTAFIATALPIDDEMSQRIDAHRASRPPHWHTVEEPLLVADAVASAAAFDVVVVDCLTVWLGNALHEGWDGARVDREARLLADLLRATSAHAYIVSNDVGLGIVPADAISRSYRDLLGRVNSTVAAACGRTLFFAAGRAVELCDPSELS